MTLWTSPLLEPEQQGIHQLPLSTGRYVAESFQHGLEETPTAQLLRAGGAAKQLGDLAKRSIGSDIDFRQLL
jgi:hypothetical protein